MSTLFTNNIRVSANTMAGFADELAKRCEAIADNGNLSDKEAVEAISKLLPYIYNLNEELDRAKMYIIAEKL